MSRSISTLGRSSGPPRAGRAIRETQIAGALAGIVASVACPYLTRSGHGAAAWAVGLVLGTGAVWLIGRSLAIDLQEMLRERQGRSAARRHIRALAIRPTSDVTFESATEFACSEGASGPELAALWAALEADLAASTGDGRPQRIRTLAARPWHPEASRILRAAAGPP